MSLLLGESRLLSFGVFAFWHDGQSPLVLASEGRVLEGNRFEVTVGDIEGEGMSFSVAFYKRAAAFGKLAQRHTDFVNLNDYTYLQVRRIRPGPRSLVECYRERHPFTLDIAYRDFEPIPLQYTPL